MISKTYKLENGLRVILIDTKAFPTMTVILLFGAGSRYENAKNNGIAHFLEHVVFKGTKKYPDFFTISSVLEGLGASHNAFTGKDHTGYWVKAPTEHFEKVLDVMGDVIQHPLLKSEDLEKEKGVIVEEINMYEDQPMRRVIEYFEQLLYQGSPLGYDVAGTKDTVTSFNRDVFTDYMKQLYGPENAVLVVAGGLNLIPQKNFLGSELASRSAGPLAPSSSSESEESLRRSLAQTSTSRENFLSSSKNIYLKIIKNKFEKWKCTVNTSFSKVKESQKEPQIKIVHKKTEQTHFCLGYRTFSFLDKRRYALSILSTVLGGGASSRLFIEVREKRGLCYYVSTGRELYPDVGYIVTQAGVTNDAGKIKESVRVIIEEQNKVAKGDVSEEELKRAKEILKGRLLLSLEDSSNVASFYGTKELLEGKIMSPEEVIREIERVMQDEVVELAKDIFKPEKLNFTLVGPFSEKDFVTLFSKL